MKIYLLHKIIKWISRIHNVWIFFFDHVYLPWVKKYQKLWKKKLKLWNLHAKLDLRKNKKYGIVILGHIVQFRVIVICILFPFHTSFEILTQKKLKMQRKKKLM